MSEPIQAIATNNYLLATPIGSGYMETSALEYDGDKISGYAGSAFKAGDEFPQSATDAIGYVTATSANIDSTIDNVSSNSGAWGGSALPISAGPGIKVEVVDNTLVFSNNDTVLWSGNSTSSGYVFELSGNISDYEYIEMYAVDVDGWGGYTKMPSEYFTTANRIPVVTQHYGTQTKNIIMRGMYVHPTSDTRLDSVAFGFDYAGTANSNTNMSMKRIVGINRK